MFFVIKYWKFFALGLGVLTLISAYFVHRFDLIDEGYKKGVYECEQVKGETINERIKTRQRQDNIGRPSIDSYIKRLREGTA